MKARAAVTDGTRSFRFVDLEVGDPGTDEVRVRVMASGVCHTDWKQLGNGNRRILGHEGAGVVESVGVGVNHVRPGDRVLLNWAQPCGACFQCELGYENVCENRPTVPDRRFLLKGKPIHPNFELGTMSTLTVVPLQAVTKIDVEIPFTTACIVGCAVMTGVGTVLNVAKVRPGASAVVLGAGGVGLSVIQGCRIAGAGRIIAVDLNPQRLEMARAFGATDVIRSRRGEAGIWTAAKTVKRLTEKRGADYAFECMSVPALGWAPLAMIRNGGTAVGVSGIEQPVMMNFELFEWDKTYINPLYGRCRPLADMPRMFRYYADGTLKLDEMVTRIYPLEELGRAFKDMLAGKNAKGVLTLQ